MFECSTTAGSSKKVTVTAGQGTSTDPVGNESNEVTDSSVVRDNQWNVRVNNWEIVRQKPLYTQSADWTLTLTDRTNPIKIHQALGNLFKDKDKVYRIDYSKCTNQKIKDKMQNEMFSVIEL